MQNWLNIDTARDLLEQGAKLIDVRTPQEFSTGHPPGAINIPIEELMKAPSLVPDGVIIFYCRSGHRSALARTIMALNNNNKTYNLGGLAEAFQLVKKEDI